MTGIKNNPFVHLPYFFMPLNKGNRRSNMINLNKRFASGIIALSLCAVSALPIYNLAAVKVRKLFFRKQSHTCLIQKMQ